MEDCDVLLIGTQECEKPLSQSLFKSKKFHWEKRLSLFKSMTLLETASLGGLHL
jgi:hypothetical protein